MSGVCAAEMHVTNNNHDKPLFPAVLLATDQTSRLFSKLSRWRLSARHHILKCVCTF